MDEFSSNSFTKIVKFIRNLERNKQIEENISYLLDKVTCWEHKGNRWSTGDISPNIKRKHIRRQKVSLIDLSRGMALKMQDVKMKTFISLTSNYDELTDDDIEVFKV